MYLLVVNCTYQLVVDVPSGCKLHISTILLYTCQVVVLPVPEGLLAPSQVVVLPGLASGYVLPAL